MPESLLQSNAKVVVRCATAADLERVIEIDRGAMYVSHWTRDAYEKYESEARDEFFHRSLMVAVEDGLVVGFIAGSFLEGDDAALLENLAVDSRWRRRGIARLLCAAMAAWAKAEGAWGIDLEVRSANGAARALYARLEFVENGLRKRYYSDPEDDAVLMRLSLQ